MDESPFNKLSAELRNKIYELVLSSPNDSYIDLESDEHARVSAITRVSKQMRKETVLLYRNLNSFVIALSHEAWSHRRWLRERTINQYTELIGKWARSQPRSHHQATGCLKLRFGVGPWAWDRFWEENLDSIYNVVGCLKSSGYESHQILVEIWIPRYPRQGQLVYSLKNVSSLRVPFRLVAAHDEHPFSIIGGTAQDSRL